jgi:hypothetical protein
VRSRSERQRRTAGCAAAALASLMMHGVSGAPEVAPGQAPSDAQVTRALEKLKNDPNLADTRKIRGLHWVGKSSPDEPAAQPPSWMEWIENLFAWLTETGRILIWAACAVVVGLLALYLLRLMRERRGAAAAPSPIAPTHVRDLDIRPESLPDDVGAASRELWDRSEHRAALALLYRGCLSRLAHVHGVPIRDSTTEGECIELATGHLSSESAAYVSHLVRVWQRAVYRGEEPSAEVAYSLGDGFRVALDPAPAPQPSELAA